MRTWLIGVVVAVLAVGAGAVGPSAGAGSEQQALSPRAGVQCLKIFTNGSGNALVRWCITGSGNIVQLESPGTFEHIKVGGIIEGYAFCYPGFSAFDSAAFEAGFHPAIFIEPNKVSRTTLDGRFRLVTTFTADAGVRRVTVQSTLTNLGTSGQGFIQLSRFFDGDIDGSKENDVWLKTQASVIGTQQHGVQLIGTTFSQTHFTRIEAFTDLVDETGCAASAPLTGPVTGVDATGRYTYTGIALVPHESKTVTFEYRLV